MPSQNLRDLLRNVTGIDKLETDGSPFYSTVAIVRQRGDSDMFYNCEPINSPSFLGQDLTPFSLDEDGNEVRNPTTKVVTKDETIVGMSDEQLRESKKSWIYDCRLAMISDSDKEQSIDNSEGMFALPTLGSLVIITYLNETDAFISMLSESSQLSFKSGDQKFIMEFRKFFDINKALAEFTGSDIFRVLTTEPDVELYIEDLIRLKNGENEIEVGQEDVVIKAFNTNADINLRSSGAIVTTSTLATGQAGEGTGLINVSGRIQVKNSIADLKDIFLTQGVDAFFDELTSVLTNMNTQLLAANGVGTAPGTAVAVSLANLSSAQTTYNGNVDKLLF